ncbi:hypothetical protein HYH03_001105 [Edaphochlamys debaryana]|uniref:Uncharacterized protein n=1 Tax=Edaphochlamys debaryana TaxID=47281 RepID=A0A835YGH1_9CHLO|nr:hypothetical protein HYH03_001105 [Edaphochlamys debaryana]|eukprot:KAG2501307.1 hypothetical protein HYH03_001105 [Edaphochlamys debaryana]
MVLPAHQVTTGFDARLRNLADRKIASVLLLQQLLYYRTYFDLIWLSYWAVFIFDQYWEGLSLNDNDIVRTVFFILWFLSEPIRLFAGWYGNLQENVPWLIIFTILTVIPQMGTILYLMVGTFRRGAYTKAIQWCQLVYQLADLFVGVYAVIVMYKRQKHQYYLFEYMLNQRVRERRAAERATAAATAR